MNSRPALASAALSPPTVRETLLAATSALLVAAVAEEEAIAWLSGVTSAVLACAASWMAHTANERRKRTQTKAERSQEWDDEQW